MWIAESLLSLVLSLSPASDVNCYQKTCHISDTGIALIKHFEGYSAYPYPDPVGIQTIGHGHVIRDGENIKIPLLPKEADSLLRKDIEKHEAGIRYAIYITLKQHQYDPLVSFAYNIGTGSLKSSTLLKKVNAKLHNEVPDQFRRWNKAGGQILNGLTFRREAEAVMYAHQN